MKKILTGLAVTALALSASVVALQAQAPTRNTWDGVFTADQAAQGKVVFDEKCALCHGTELAGAEMAPPLTGAIFFGNWNGQAVGDLFARIHGTMPANDPGSLSNAQTAQIVAYILSYSQMPAGATPLPSEEAALSQITIASQKPAGK